ncbi:HIT family protein, partial [[Eubacterium] siraeum]|nr:HIT family protein [[Eubacterium] siraeum]
PMEKMYNDNNRPSKTELEDMKEKLLIELENLL